ncbi:iron-siderophore ABC transporter substrate-binding protein [Testudinibacter sp. TR-2022]|uniref:iron-siderophore ABC transporter substrate-binding protein n=1 Tax=Testudinibacter sp. TR-2022 TaxID=2585029 RepID=UPI0022778153|nr:iron-siderophore ABC transporter substrate-binding protein [Testudinibacter sp. TR-2022]
MKKSALLRLSLALLMLCSYRTFAQVNSPDLKVATLDWTVAETLLALGQPPIAVGDAESYRTWVSVPELPPHTLDLGTRLQPNQELLAKLQPDRFINSAMFSNLTPILQHADRRQQVDEVNFYREGEIWQNQLAATRELAKLIAKPQRAESLIQQTEQLFAQLKTQLTSYQNRTLLLVQFIDSRHLRVYGENSLFGAAIRQMGFHNAWTAPVTLWGSTNIGINQLAEFKDNPRLIVIKPYPVNVPTALEHNTLWQHLPLSKDPIVLPAIWTFGALPSAQRFALALADALQQGGEPW